MASTCASSDTSTVTAVAAPPAATISVVTDSASAATTSATTTLAPSAAKRIAVTRPMPLPAPVITATLPSSRPIDFSVAFRECVRPAPYWDIARSGILVHAVDEAGPSHRSHHVPPGRLVGASERDAAHIPGASIDLVAAAVMAGGQPVLMPPFDVGSQG